MSEAPVEGGNNSGETPAADEFKAITTQEDLNKVISDRVARERAKYADYKDVKAKAAELDQIKQANQTEAEKAAAKVAELEAELNNTRRDSMRIKIASAHGITDADDIELFLTGTDEETLTKQATRLAGRTADRTKNGNHVPTEGSTPSSAGGAERETVRGLFGGD
jgi:hypothetical protein